MVCLDNHTCVVSTRSSFTYGPATEPMTERHAHSKSARVFAYVSALFERVFEVPIRMPVHMAIPLANIEINSRKLY